MTSSPLCRVLVVGLLSLVWLETGQSAPETNASNARHRVIFDIGDSAHPIAYSMEAEGDAAVSGNGTVEIDVEKDVPAFIDDSTFTVRYSFGAGRKFLTLRRSEIPWPPIPGKPKSFGLWLKGDGRGLQTRIRFKDATGQVFQSDAATIDWKGWRLVIFPMQSSAEKALTYSGGANDGQIHYPLRWEMPLVLENISQQPLEGEIAISMPTLID